MIFWDASGIVPLLVTEPLSESVRALLRSDPGMLVWWGTPIECASAIARREREGGLTPAQADASRARLAHLCAAWNEVLPSEDIRFHAARLLRLHPLRSADAIQLAAAWVWAGGRPRQHAFLTFDARLRSAARLEGFGVPGAAAVGGP
jgi:predicted nucleic acid-binding protein